MNDALAVFLALQAFGNVTPNMDQFVTRIPVSEGVVDVRRVVDRDLRLFTATLISAVPMDQAPSFNELLDAIDEASIRSARSRQQSIEQQRA